MSITLEQVVATADEIVEGFPENYEYPGWDTVGCYYSNPEGEPSCLVGHVAYRLEPSAFNTFVKFEQDGDSFAINSTEARYPTEKFHLDDNARLFLALVQAQQDTGNTWRRSVRYAKEQMGAV